MHSIWILGFSGFATTISTVNTARFHSIFLLGKPALTQTSTLLTEFTPCALHLYASLGWMCPLRPLQFTHCALPSISPCSIADIGNIWSDNHGYELEDAYQYMFQRLTEGGTYYIAVFNDNGAR